LRMSLDAVLLPCERGEEVESDVESATAAVFEQASLGESLEESDSVAASGLVMNVFRKNTVAAPSRSSVPSSVGVNNALRAVKEKEREVESRGEEVRREGIRLKGIKLSIQRQEEVVRGKMGRVEDECEMVRDKCREECDRERGEVRREKQRLANRLCKGGDNVIVGKAEGDKMKRLEEIVRQLEEEKRGIEERFRAEKVRSRDIVKELRGKVENIDEVVEGWRKEVERVEKEGREEVERVRGFWKGKCRRLEIRVGELEKGGEAVGGEAVGGEAVGGEAEGELKVRKAKQVRQRDEERAATSAFWCSSLALSFISLFQTATTYPPPPPPACRSWRRLGGGGRRRRSGRRSLRRRWSCRW